MKELKLHLGCGNDYRKGYVNCDMSKEVNPDKVVDLEKPLKMFKDNSVDEIVANHVLEHIQNFIPLIHEFHRICKKGAKIKIKVPFYSSWGQFNDPTHVRSFTPFTFGYFRKGNYSHEVSANKDMFDISKVKINYGVGASSKLNWLMNPIVNFHHALYCRFFAWILPSSELEFELIVIK
ncbi:MAG: methyltransferase domain-containing protein [Nanoarchaeota archaeon]|jgi:SAM-dependent methyltransferase|nr:methyltransferase domain-containing protein [Nanoarchaeota archaeon]